MGWGFGARQASVARAVREEAEAPRLAAAEEEGRDERGSWSLAEGDELAPGLRVLRSLGGGSRYEVFLVWHERLFALAVAKVLRPEAAADARALRDLRREAELLDRLAHPCLVRGFGAVVDGPRPHLVLEHVEGPTLGSLLKKYGPLPLHQLLPLALHVTAVLHYLSVEGHVHLDVKPANIIMGVPPRLIDLSIARTHASAARLADAIGTDAYMAPEQCRPELAPGAVGTPADVFGLGATLHHAASGKVPFERPRGARRSAVLEERFPQLVRDAAPLADDLPAAFVELVLRMMARRPEDRPSPADVAHALEPLVAEVPDRLQWSRRRGLIAP
jgi:serine/threonine protein kinase